MEERDYEREFKKAMEQVKEIWGDLISLSKKVPSREEFSYIYKWVTEYHVDPGNVSLTFIQLANSKGRENVTYQMLDERLKALYDTIIQNENAKQEPANIVGNRLEKKHSMKLEKQSGIKTTVYKTDYDIEVVVFHYEKEDKYRSFITSIRNPDDSLEEIDEHSADHWWEEDYVRPDKDWKDKTHYENIKEYMKAMEPVIQHYIAWFETEYIDRHD